MRLYSYYRSSSAYRVRIALNLKELSHEIVPIHLLRDGGQQNAPAFLATNPMSQIPVLEVDGHFLAQSMAIVLYLEDRHPRPALFSQDPFEKARQVEICEIINSGIQPLQNLTVANELGHRFHADAEAKKQWTRKWVEKGLAALEEKLHRTAGSFCFGGTPSAADCFLVPQLFSARRFGVETNSYALLAKIEKNCAALPAFQAAEPGRQMDSEAK